MWLDYGVTLFWLVNIWGGEIIRGRKDNQKDRRMKWKEKSLTVDWVWFSHIYYFTSHFYEKILVYIILTM